MRVKKRSCRCSRLTYVNTRLLKQLIDSAHTVDGLPYLVTDNGTCFGHRFTYQDVVNEYSERMMRESERQWQARERAEREYRREYPTCTACGVSYDKSLKNFTLKSNGRPRSRCKRCRSELARIPF